MGLRASCVVGLLFFVFLLFLPLVFVRVCLAPLCVAQVVALTFAFAALLALLLPTIFCAT